MHRYTLYCSSRVPSICSIQLGQCRIIILYIHIALLLLNRKTLLELESVETYSVCVTVALHLLSLQRATALFLIHSLGHVEMMDSVPVGLEQGDPIVSVCGTTFRQVMDVMVCMGGLAKRFWGNHSKITMVSVTSMLATMRFSRKHFTFCMYTE